MSVKKAIILGSGLSVFENDKPNESIPYADIEGWPLGNVKGHKGVLDKYDNIWVLRGRSHIYEGFSWAQAQFPTEYISKQGIKELIITNAAGGISPDFNIGDLMQIHGYLDFMKPEPMLGKLKNLNQSVQEITTSKIKNLHDDITLHHGIYTGVHGPNYETNTEVDLFRQLGGHAVGMSTIPELEVAKKYNLKVTAVSIITNVYGKTDDLGHEGVVNVAKEAGKKLQKLLNL